MGYVRRDPALLIEDNALESGSIRVRQRKNGGDSQRDAKQDLNEGQSALVAIYGQAAALD
jgi:hypothetical protein